MKKWKKRKSRRLKGKRCGPNKRIHFNPKYKIADIVYVKEHARPKPTKIEERLYFIEHISKPLQWGPTYLYYLVDLETNNKFYCEESWLIKVNNNDEILTPYFEAEKLFGSNI